MADPLLTSLCAICHISPPQYKCPRCSIRTCSLPCIKKHKAWSECNGIRDATTYIPPRKLRTPAGVDHDYNFLSSIERSRERSEKLIVDREILGEQDLRPLTVQQIEYRRGKDGAKALRDAATRSEVRLRARLKKQQIHVIHAPSGMTRRKENRTNFIGNINKVSWQVEWLVLREPSINDTRGEQWHRILSKVLDETPLYQAFHRTLEFFNVSQKKTDGEKKADEHKTSEGYRKNHRKKRRQFVDRGQPAQNVGSSTWNFAVYSLQDPHTGAWTSQSGPGVAEWPSELEESRKQQYSFFLAKPFTRPQTLIQLEPTDNLKTALSFKEVLEFPTIYVVEKSLTLPGGFDIEAGAARGGTKRKRDDRGPKQGERRRRKRGRFGAEGEVLSDEEVMLEGEKACQGSGDESNIELLGGGLEEGEVIAEEVIGEDTEGGEDDTTSSSGSESD